MVFLKKKTTNIFVFELTTYWSPVITTTEQRQLWVGDTEKLAVAFTYAWLKLIEFP